MNPDTKSAIARRNLLKALAAGGAAVVGVKTLPDSWVRPIIDSVELPLHAQSSCLTYGATGLTASGFSSNELATVCVTVCGSTATATFQTVFDGAEVRVRRTGSFVSGVGTMAITSAGVGCSIGAPRAATLTSITSSSLTFTMARGDNVDFVAVLPLVAQCPTFLPVNGDCPEN